MRNIITTITGLFILCNNLFAQNTHFTTSGSIEFEKKVNVYAIIGKQIASYDSEIENQAFDIYKKNNPQFKTLKSILTFSGSKTLYTPVIPADDNSNSFFTNHPMINQNNIIYNDLVTGMTTSQKAVFEEKFLVKDTTRKIKWKITDETREIAGYTCRRANAVILDSIYVVAFYTTEIAVSGGPESFNGLPGMILGVALPHENVTWFATKVMDVTEPESALTPPKKGKATNNKGLRATLESAFKDWGNYAKMYYKAFML